MPCDPSSSPVTGWRAWMASLAHLSCRLLGSCAGLWVRRLGQQVSREDAPVLAAAPHSTILDWVVIGHTRSSPVAKQSLSAAPVLGRVAGLVQTVWVDRDGPASKAATLSTLQQRAITPGWPQTLIFPEGTNTNGQALVQFRTGAFNPGVPVQPVCLRSYSEKSGKFLPV